MGGETSTWWEDSTFTGDAKGGGGGGTTTARAVEVGVGEESFTSGGGVVAVDGEAEDTIIVDMPVVGVATALCTTMGTDGTTAGGEIDSGEGVSCSCGAAFSGMTLAALEWVDGLGVNGGFPSSTSSLAVGTRISSRASASLLGLSAAEDRLGVAGEGLLLGGGDSEAAAAAGDGSSRTSDGAAV